MEKTVFLLVNGNYSLKRTVFFLCVHRLYCSLNRHSYVLCFTGVQRIPAPVVFKLNRPKPF